MKNAWLTLAVVCLAVGWTAGATAAPKKSKPPIGTNPNPVVWPGRYAKPSPPPPAVPNRNEHHAPSHHATHACVRFRGCYPFAGGYGYDSRFIDGYWYPYGYPPFYYPYPEDLYGPLAGQRLYGLGVNGLLQQPAVTYVIPREVEDDAPAMPLPNKGAERATNAKSVALAWRFIGFGDAQFAEEKFSEANSRYRKASQAAPQLADAWFRQGLALSAMGRYERAVAAIQRGLRINPKWPASDFDLGDLCGNDDLVQRDLLDTLADATDQEPNDANVLFLAGVHFHFAGQPDRAREFFRRAADIARDEEHIAAFLAK